MIAVRFIETASDDIFVTFDRDTTNAAVCMTYKKNSLSRTEQQDMTFCLLGLLVPARYVDI